MNIGQTVYVKKPVVKKDGSTITTEKLIGTVWAKFNDQEIGVLLPDGYLFKGKEHEDIEVCYDQ